jgi:hypothetical protein
MVVVLFMDRYQQGGTRDPKIAEKDPEKQQLCEVLSIVEGDAGERWWVAASSIEKEWQSYTTEQKRSCGVGKMELDVDEENMQDGRKSKRRK